MTFFSRHTLDAHIHFKLNSPKPLNRSLLPQPPFSRHPRWFTSPNSAPSLQELLQKISLSLRGDSSEPNNPPGSAPGECVNCDNHPYLERYMRRRCKNSHVRLSDQSSPMLDRVSAATYLFHLHDSERTRLEFHQLLKMHLFCREAQRLIIVTFTAWFNCT